MPDEEAKEGDGDNGNNGEHNGHYNSGLEAVAAFDARWGRRLAAVVWVDGDKILRHRIVRKEGLGN